MGQLSFTWRLILAGVLLAFAVILFARSVMTGGGLLPRRRLVPWLRGFRLAALALGCSAAAAGLATNSAWLVGVGLAFGLEETMETSVCLSALNQSRQRPSSLRPRVISVTNGIERCDEVSS